MDKINSFLFPATKVYLYCTGTMPHFMFNLTNENINFITYISSIENTSKNLDFLSSKRQRDLEFFNIYNV